MAAPLKSELLGLDIQELTVLVQDAGEPDYRARQLFEAIYRQRVRSLEEISTLPLEFRRALSQRELTVGQPRIEKQYVSSDGTIRYLIAFSDGQSVETVWMPDGDGGEAGDGSDSGDEELAELPKGLSSLPEDLSSRGRAATEGSASTGNRLLATGNFSQRATICVSSQVGCAVDCKFCMTALLGLKRNLTPGEITGQVLAVLNDQHVAIDRDRINLVFMGQGEPFLNYDNFMQAVRRLVTDAGIPASRMTVSTSGIIPRIADFAAEEVRPKLAVSLNASNEAQRTEVMPITKKWTIANLLAALRDFPLRNRERLTFEYVLLGGLNDEPRHARELIDLIRGLRAKVNLIALNPGPEIPYAMPDADRVAAFQAILIAAGIPAFLRRPRGRDIYAACGQLKHTTELVQLAGNSE